MFNNLRNRSGGIPNNPAVAKRLVSMGRQHRCGCALLLVVGEQLLKRFCGKERGVTARYEGNPVFVTQHVLRLHHGMPRSELFRLQSIGCPVTKKLLNLVRPVANNRHDLVNSDMFQLG